MTFERGVPINSPVMLSLPQERRNQLGEASLEIAVRELFEWGEMQTDPNFGNYLVRLGNGDDVYKGNTKYAIGNEQRHGHDKPTDTTAYNRFT